MRWMKNSRGRPDALLSFAALAVVVVLLKVLLNGVAACGVTFGAIDATLAAAVLAATLGAYTTKRVKVDHDKPEAPVPPAAGFARLPLLLVLLGVALFAAEVARAAVPCPNPHRSQAAVALFKAQWSAAHGGLACPKSCATYTRVGRAFVLYDRCGACEVDHIVPLACCGPDTPSNMQWLPARENRAKGATCPVTP